MCENIKFKHHFLLNGAVLTIATNLNSETRSVKVGWSVFNPNDSKWIKKIGAKLARERLENDPMEFNLSSYEPIVTDYITLRALLLIASNIRNKNNSVSKISEDTKSTLSSEIHYIVNLFTNRFMYRGL